MRKNTGFFYLFLLLSLIWLLAGCSKKAEDEKDELPEGTVYAYFVNSEQTGLLKEEYTLEDESEREKSVRELLNELSTPQKDVEYRDPIPEGVQVEDIEIVDENVILDFSSEYDELENYEEILLRAAVVSTLTQISGVETVEFKVDGKLLTKQDGNSVGPMSEESFVDAIQSEDGGTKTTVRLYFADKTGKYLKSYEVTLQEESKTPIDQAILELLIEGPTKKGYYRTLPKSLKILKVSTKNRVCYVDLDSKILDTYKNLRGEISIYSIVNSLTAISNIDKVQFTVNGKKVNMIREDIVFDKSFERNLDLVQGE